MIQGTTPTLYFAFGIDLSTLKEWKVVFAQEDKDNLVKTQADCLIGENNIIYLKLSQEETLALDYTKLVEIQAKVLTTDNNVFASNLVRTTVGKILDKTQYSAENGEILPIGNEKIIDLTFDTTCGFALEFGDKIVYRESPIDKELKEDSENAIANKAVYEAVKALEKLIAESGGGGSVTITIDKEINAESTNPVENQAIAKALDNKVNKLGNVGYRVYTSANGVDSSMAYTDSATGETLAQRDSNGTFSVSDATKDSNPVTLGQFNEKLEDIPNDVQINGTSIVKDGVANISNAGAGKLGVVTASSNYGISVNANNGNLSVSRANASNISSLSNVRSVYCPIVPASMHYAIKTALATMNTRKDMTTPSGISLDAEYSQVELTDIEKEEIQKWLGIGGNDSEWIDITLNGFDTSTLTATIESDAQINYVEYRGFVRINRDDGDPVIIPISSVFPIDAPPCLLGFGEATINLNIYSNSSGTTGIISIYSGKGTYLFDQSFTKLKYRIINF